MKARENSIQALQPSARTGDCKILLATLLCSVSLVAIPQQAVAQSATESAKEDNNTIIVTARKRSESVQDVPATLNVLQGDALADQGVTQFSELQYAVPGFYVQNFETRATITLRGVGSQIEGGSSAVAIHTNGIYLASSAAQLNRLFDVERVEVVKGPQGTLYGRNSTGGAINVITRKAGDTFEGDVSLSYGSFNTKRADAAVSIPLAEGWGLRFAGSYAKGNGLFENVVTGNKIGNEDFWGGRVTLSGEAGPVKVDLFVQYAQDNDTRGVSLIPLQAGTKIPLLGFRKTAFDDPTEPKTDRRPFLAGMTLDADLGGGFGARSITGYLDYSEPRSETDVNPKPNLPSRLFISFPQSSEQFSQEFQLLYGDDRLDALLSFFYLDDKQGASRFAQLRPANFTLLNSISDNDVEAVAIFGDVNYKLTDGLTVNAGLRWNNEKIRNASVGTGAFDGKPFDLGGTQSKATGRIGLSYEPTPGYLFYGSVSNGFLAGQYAARLDSVSLVSTAREVRPEKIVAYELGAKSMLSNGLGFLNASVFQYNYDDLQVTVGGLFLLPNGNPDPAKPPFFFTDNAAKSRIRGAEVQWSDFRVANFLKFDANLAYTDAKYLNYISVLSNRSVADFTGNTLPRTPKWNLTSAVTLDNLELVGKAVGTIRAEYNYRSKTFFTRENTEVSSQNSLSLVNAFAKVDMDDGKWGMQFSVRNLTNKQFFNFLRNDPFATVGEFRTFEASVFFKF